MKYIEVEIKIKMEKSLQEIYLTYYNLLIALWQDLWQERYQILSIISLKKFVKLNVNTNTMAKNVKLEELNINIATVFLQYTNCSDDLID